LLKLLVKQAKKIGRRPVDEETLLIAGLDDDLRACSRFITLFFGVSSNRAVTVSSMIRTTLWRCSSRFTRRHTRVRISLNAIC
jgi:hypothetical protein